METKEPMIQKNKSYTYEELKIIIREAAEELIMNPLTADEEEIVKRDSKDEFKFKMSMMLSAIPLMHNLEDMLFGSEE